MGTYINPVDIYNNKMYGISSTAIDSITVEYYITKSEGRINGMVGKRYTLPFGDVPEIIPEYSKDLAAAYYYLDLYPNDNVNRNDWAEFKYQTIMQELQDIVDGKLDLTHSNTVLPTKQDNKYITTRNYPLPMDMDSSLNWKVPGQLLTQIENNRASAE